MTERIKNYSSYWWAKLCPLVVGILFAFNFYASATEYVLGVNSSNALFLWTGGTSNDTWKSLSATSAFSHIAVGPYGFWAITASKDANGNGVIKFSASKPDDSAQMTWIQIPGGLVQLDVDNNTGEVWGVNSFGEIYYRKGITAQNPIGTDWVLDPANGRLKYVSVGQNCVWGVNSAFGIFRKAINTGTQTTAADITPRINAGWTQMRGTAMCVSIGNQYVYHLSNQDGAILFKTLAGSINNDQAWGTYNPQKPDGTKLTLKQISAGSTSVWGTGWSDDLIWRANEPYGYTWTPLTNGRLKQVDIGDFKPSIPTNAANYGNYIVLKHKTTSRYLAAFPNILYNHTGSSKQGVIAGRTTPKEYWLIQGRYNSATPTTPVKLGDIIRLAAFNGYYLHSHTNKSPISSQQEVTAYGTDDANNNWTIYSISYNNSPSIYLVPGAIVRLIHTATGYALHSHTELYTATNSPSASLIGLNEVTTYGGNDENDLWIVEEISTTKPLAQIAQTFVNAVKTNMTALDYKTKIANVLSLLGDAQYANLNYSDLKNISPTN